MEYGDADFEKHHQIFCQHYYKLKHVLISLTIKHEMNLLIFGFI